MILLIKISRSPPNQTLFNSTLKIQFIVIPPNVIRPQNSQQKKKVKIMNGNFLGFLFAAQNYLLTNDAIKITSINLLRNGENGENVTEM